MSGLCICTPKLELTRKAVYKACSWSGLHRLLPIWTVRCHCCCMFAASCYYADRSAGPGPAISDVGGKLQRTLSHVAAMLRLG